MAARSHSTIEYDSVMVLMNLMSGDLYMYMYNFDLNKMTAMVSIL